MSSQSYDGKITTSGSSQAIRIIKSFFDANPEFEQKANIKAYPIGKGKALISVEPPVNADEKEDPLFDAFLSFLEKDMIENPQNLIPATREDFIKTKDLLEGVKVTDDEEMPEDFEL